MTKEKMFVIKSMFINMGAIYSNNYFGFFWLFLDFFSFPIAGIFYVLSLRHKKTEIDNSNLK